MNERFARILSILFHPLLIPTYTLLILLYLDRSFLIILPLPMKLLVIGTVLITTCMLPLFIIFLMYRFRLVSSMYLPKREERIFPLISTAIFYYLTFYLLKDLYIPDTFQLFILGATIVTVILVILTLFLRISFHTTAMGAVTGLFLGMAVMPGKMALYLLIISVILSGLVSSARLKVNAHQPVEVYSGWLAGAVVMCMISFLF